LLTTTDTTDFPGYIHSNLSSVSGCYAVTAIDNVGNESTKSNKVCLENCFLFELPNVFTPDNSGINDLFRPIPPSPRFVESVKFSVFNRWGLKVFENNNDVYINWDGSGLPDGVYFYTAKVKFTSPDEYSSTKDLKGWIQILR
ncbi:MAG: gliding motility-associated C-terminal domain-containing protein, partial [Opitutaceae bacterium]|nr:gliding motility-associated C-terminal domain-containing protein [Cytophagales bacterium]